MGWDGIGYDTVRYDSYERVGLGTPRGKERDSQRFTVTLSCQLTSCFSLLIDRRAQAGMDWIWIRLEVCRRNREHTPADAHTQPCQNSSMRRTRGLIVFIFVFVFCLMPSEGRLGATANDKS